MDLINQKILASCCNHLVKNINKYQLYTRNKKDLEDFFNSISKDNYNILDKEFKEIDFDNYDNINVFQCLKILEYLTTEAYRDALYYIDEFINNIREHIVSNLKEYKECNEIM